MASMSPKKSASAQRCLFSALNFARQRPILVALLSLLFLVYLLGIFSSEQPSSQQEFVLVQDKSLQFESLKDVVTFLRAGDKRLVRPSPSEKTWNRQEGDACGHYLDQAYEALCGLYSENIERDAIELITLCTTDRPENRAKLTAKPHDSVPRALVNLLSKSYATGAAAAECIWISSFASKSNYDAFVREGAVERLSNMITSVDCDDEHPKDRGNCYLSQMWAGAALQNLAAAYCGNDDSPQRCYWEWNGVVPGSKEKRQTIGITNELVVWNPESLRLNMIQNTKLLDSLTKIICDNVEELDKSPSERTWPSRAQIDETKLSSVAAWGAIGAIRNLALSPTFYENMPPNLQECLCAHAMRSPDWLENSKAKDAIYRLGFNKNDACEPLYDRSKCKDYQDWVDEDGESCRKYEKERWCAEYRDYAPEGDDKYVTAGEACCACGGGTKLV